MSGLLEKAKEFTLEDMRALCKFHAAHFGINTCYDYIADISLEDDQYTVTVFVEPGGNIEKSGDTCASVLTWWQECFMTQPDGWDHRDAGWHLFDMEQLPDDVGRVWECNQ